MRGKGLDGDEEEGARGTDQAQKDGAGGEGTGSGPSEEKLQSLVSQLAEGHIEPGAFETSAVPAMQQGTGLGMVEISKIYGAYGKLEEKPGGAMLKLLEAQAVKEMPGFGTRAISDTMSGCAKIKQHPGREMLLRLEERASELDKEFDPPEIASTLWAYGTLGIHPGQELMKKLEAQAVSKAGEFTEKEVEDTLWAFSTLNWQPGEGVIKRLEGKPAMTEEPERASHSPASSRSSDKQVRASSSSQSKLPFHPNGALGTPLAPRHDRP
jgi:hypothetical protein